MISGVTWRPFYDLHATSVDGQPSRDVSVRYCVAITQSTGEDWENMALTLSTASSQALRQLTVPALSPHKIIVPVSADSPKVRAETDALEQGSSISVDPPPRPMRRMGPIRARKSVNEAAADNAPPDDMDMLNVAG